ncbi:hypothetical protein [Enterococcus faecium]|uniref:hypothetical protein n=1 Tax=Enterococcus faecium TaxID=1352 RepID=UPI001FD7DD8A|nr:hypothetical protein [Enterococcus faecium]
MANQFRLTNVLNPGKEVKSKVLQFKVIEADNLVKNQLNMQEDTFVYDIYRKRNIEGKLLIDRKNVHPYRFDSWFVISQY